MNQLEIAVWAAEYVRSSAAEQRTPPLLPNYHARAADEAVTALRAALTAPGARNHLPVFEGDYVVEEDRPRFGTCGMVGPSGGGPCELNFGHDGFIHRAGGREFTVAHRQEEHEERQRVITGAPKIFPFTWRCEACDQVREYYKNDVVDNVVRCSCGAIVCRVFGKLAATASFTTEHPPRKS